MSVAVIFLARGVGGGIGAAEAFFASYRTHPAGVHHRLVVLAKGWEGVPGRARLDDLARKHDAAIIDLPDDGFDWGAYMRATPRLDEDWACFLNTHSRILTDGWLAKLCSAVEQPRIGAAGATGSWGTLAPVFQFLSPTIRDIYHGAGFIKATIAAGYMYTLGYPLACLRNGNRFPPFPNFHLRSNAFLINRKLFLEYANTVSLPRSKPDAFDLEWQQISHPLPDGARTCRGGRRRRWYRLPARGMDGEQHVSRAWSAEPYNW